MPLNNQSFCPLSITKNFGMHTHLANELIYLNSSKTTCRFINIHFC